MVQLIVGEKGKGKTKVLLDKVNNEIKTINGNVVYLDKSTEHMFELNNRIRLIDVCEYNITNADQFIGFVTGIISQDHDLEQMYLDCLMKIANIDSDGIVPLITEINKVSEAFKVDFIVSVTMDSGNVPSELKDMVIEAL
ncbi:MAG: twitching motility protein PilT [Lachnospiraceae bacterium]|nr:twitching motility protein PilT [Lachnospiraceae bacterium]MCR4596668.1 twitching motility protein PilT [Lachnospiraceae bacterium]